MGRWERGRKNRRGGEGELHQVGGVVAVKRGVDSAGQGAMS